MVAGAEYGRVLAHAAGVFRGETPTEEHRLCVLFATNRLSKSFSSRGEQRMSDDMPRPVTVPDERLLDELEKGDSPIRTVSEIESEVDLSADGIRRRLLKLEDEGRAVSKTVGANAVVWWRSD